MRPSLLGKLLYGITFTLLVPAGLVLWSRGAAPAVTLPAWQSLRWGLLMIAGGVTSMTAAMWTLWSHGRGLPMNAYPPPQYVSTGIYAIVPHPIYGAFVVLCIGTSLYFGSAAGLWLVTPIVALSCVGLVLGYELPDLRKRFGKALETTSFLPPDLDASPSMLMRVRCYVTVIVPWMVLYEACVLKGAPSNAWSTALPIDFAIPFLPWTETLYASTYLVVASLPLVLHTQRELREFCRLALLSFAIVFPFLFFVPLVTGLSLPDMPGRWATIVQMERQLDSTACALPSYHVVWSLIAATLLGGKSRTQRIAWYVWAAAVAVSCLTTRAHTFLDVVAAVFAYLLIVQSTTIWRWMFARSEALANSWKEWRVGPVRIINHGVYAGAAVAVYIFLIDALLGPGHQVVSAMIFVANVMGAAFWAQYVEGSPALLRPLGFYGGMLGTLLAVVFGRLMGVSVWTLLAAVCIAAPWLQAIGRLRCFVQGCCHGGPSDEPGIHYVHPRSRVLRIAGMRGVPLHPTQLYSILGNAFVVLVLTRLFLSHSPSTLICGVYLILSGLFRFVEESLRGEPQTPVKWGLRLYQWVAVVSVVCGAVVTTLAGPAAPAFTPRFSSVILGLACGLAGWFVAGIDFPESNRRFARLT